MDQEPIRVIAGDRFAELLCRPLCCGMCGHITVEDFPRADLHDYEHVEPAERSCYDRGKVTGYKSTCVIVYKRLPALGRHSSWTGAHTFGPILLHCSGRYQDAKFE